MFDPLPTLLRDLPILIWMVIVRIVVPLTIVLAIGYVIWRMYAPQQALVKNERFSRFVLRVRELPTLQLPVLSARQIMTLFIILMVWIGALGFLIARYFFGLNTATALNDYAPWGLWIAFKLSFVACAAGGFTFAAVVYVFRLDQYRPLARTAILTGLIGYTTFVISLIFDLGRWYNILHVIYMWNLHSVMFEIAWCVMLYLTVLYMEFSSTIFERLGWKRHERIMHAITLPVVVAGVVLSTLHQSSLGSLYLIMPTKLYPLWWSMLQPVFFFTSAIAAGLAMMMVIPVINVRAFKAVDLNKLLATLAKPTAVVLTIYLILKVGDLTLRGQLPRLLMPNAMSGLWWLEVLFGIIVPLAILYTPRATEDPRVRFRMALLVIGGVVLNRFNVALFGFTEFWSSIKVTYVPSFGEWVITLALVAAAFVAYVAAVKLLPVLPQPPRERAIQGVIAE